jgi:predicted RNA-binding Zn ribbon-like protein
MATKTCEDACYTLEEGHVVLDFINTAYTRFDDDAPYGYEPVEEHLTGIAALAEWSARLGLLEADEAALLAEAELPGRLEQLLDLREALRRVFRAHIHAQPMPGECLDAVNTAIRPVLRYTRIEPAEEGFRVRMDCGGPTGDPSLVLDRVLWAVSQSAIALLTNPKELEMVEECPGDDCGYLFRDTSHGRRRWCSMRSCGNRAKVQRFRDRQREEAVA